MSAITTVILPATDTKPMSVRAHMDGRPDEVIHYNQRHTPIANHQEAARLLLSRIPSYKTGESAMSRDRVGSGWHTDTVTSGKMVHILADPNKAL